jgi:ATP-dependent exoDNAse (exonuclease V) beta subunit
MTERPPDQADRDRIAGQLDATIFVEAGAGSGKTTALIDRFVALVLDGVPVERIAAITFTEKAATELRDRARTALERARADHGGPTDVVDTALDHLDRAAIGTLHAFAQRVLAEHPLEAGLPPAVEVLDEISSQLAFERRWAGWRQQLLDDPATSPLVVLGRALGITLEHLRQVALGLRSGWDVLERHPVVAPASDPSFRPVEWAQRLVIACRERELGPPGCRLVEHLDRVEAWAVSLLHALDDAEALALLVGRPSLKRRLGRADDWRRTYRAGRFADLDALRDHLVGLDDELAQAVAGVRDQVLRHLTATIAQHTLADAEQRRAEGRLEFHDLLVLARRLVADPTSAPLVRRALHQRYERLLLDEVQDTDPIQIELAVRIAADPSAEADDWRDLPVPAGRLFFVGDPKQSIYRFRRADIGLFLDAQDRFADAPATLSTCFRTVEPVVSWVNEVFARLIEASPGSQPAYVPLAAVRAPEGGPGVVVVGREPHLDDPAADELRAREAADVVAAVRTALAEGWPVYDEEAERWRPARPGDIAVLLPTRLWLAAVEQALDTAGIGYRAESSSLVYATDEIRDLLLTLRAVDDPTDELALVAALRSPVFGCSDADLYRWRVVLGRRFEAPEPGDAADDDPVGAALTEVAGWRATKAWSTPSQLLDEVIGARGLLELAVVDGRPDDRWRRLRFLVDQARAWSDAGNSGLRDYLAWASRQADETSRVAEVVLPETDTEAVRLMTIHAAKGLEFPIAVVAGLSTEPRGAVGVQVAFPPGQPPAVRTSAENTTEAFEAFRPVDQQMGFHERIRLLYVACTRARDHLVVSLHRKHERGINTKASNAELLAAAGAADRAAPLVPVAATTAVTPPGPPPTHPWDDADAWRVEHDRAMGHAGRPGTVAATTLARDAFPPGPVADDGDDPRADAGLAKDPPDLEQPPWHKGRYGTAVGRAVHAVLQTVDLATGAGLDDAAAAQAAAEGVLGQEALVAALARAALAAPAVREAATAEHWREVYVAAPQGDTLLEGYVDLLYRTPDGLVVVDYKTDHAPDEAHLEAKLERYRLQGGAYAAAVADATGETVVRCVFIFCSPEGPRQRDLPRLAAAVADVRARLGAAAGDASRTRGSA